MDQNFEIRIEGGIEREDEIGEMTIEGVTYEFDE